jgi:carboxyl-terminal processing protease
VTPRRRRSPLVSVLALLVPVALVLGVWLGGHPDRLPGFARDTLVGDKQEAVVREALDVIAHDYYRKVSESDLVNQGLTGSVAGLHDRFSHYLDPKAYRQFSDSTGGRFSGVGITVSSDKRGLKVVQLIPRSPAARSGLRPGDVIVAVDGSRLAGKPEEVSSSLIRGRAGTRVKLTYVRGPRRQTVSVERAQITTPVVTSRMLHAGARKIGYVSLSTFAVSGAHAQVAQAVRRLRAKGARGLILDLRDNGGGLLDEAVLVASVFIQHGTIVSTDGRSRDRQTYPAVGDAVAPTTPLVVLMNRGTASSSEIVSGALQDTHRAKLVGTHSFGKGVFQEVKRLSNGGALSITVGQYFLPSGRNLGGHGVREGSGLKPDVAVGDQPKAKGDEQLRAALKTVAAEVR